jgi:hypothetical protein
MRAPRLLVLGLLACIALVASPVAVPYARAGAPAAAATTPSATSPSPRALAAGSIGIRLLDVPATEINDPRAHLYIVDRLAPGSVTRRLMEVDNTTSTSRVVDLYASAATIAGGKFLGSVGHSSDELSSWMSVDPATAVIAAGGHLAVAVTIAVAPKAAPGERYAVVWAQTTSEVGGFEESNRVGIRLYVSVGRGNAPAADFAITSLTAHREADGRPLVVAMVRNTGGRALDMSGTLRLLDGPGGLQAGPFPAQLGTTLAIADTEPVTVALSRQVPAGPWDARITLRSGLVVRSARAEITFPAAGTGAAVTTVPINGSRRPVLVAVLIAVVVVAVAVAVVLLLLRRRRRRRPRSGRLARAP